MLAVNDAMTVEMSGRIGQGFNKIFSFHAYVLHAHTLERLCVYNPFCTSYNTYFNLPDVYLHTRGIC